ncbi:hypothetical protein F4808DRAFT_215015 [Astrocystis sublimbata]|nr:hypothetical protein F4808DRAFT_215015 [Astrocystis sublimbata]
MADSNQQRPLTEEEQKKQTMMEWAQEKYNEQYDSWMPWIEDMYLKYFTKDNRTSYATRDTLDRTKVTGIDQVDTLQDKTHDLAASTVGQGGILEPVGNLGSSAMKAVDPRGKKDPKDEVDENVNKGTSGITSNIPVVSGLGL